MKPLKKIIVIGAGAAGAMAAISAAKRGSDVMLFDNNRAVGKKIRITGKGRCNITNNCTVDEFLDNVPRNGKFLYSAITELTPQLMMNFLENGGLPLKVERGKRVFPVSDDANDVADFFAKMLYSLNCKVINKRVKGLIVDDGFCKGVELADGAEVMADSVIVATGGVSYQKTGSSGDGYVFARSVGHTVVPAKPSLVPLVSSQKFCGDLQGLSLKNVKICVMDKPNNRCVYEDFGEMLFTHFGVSGPIILSASAHMGDIRPGKYAVEIDLKPALDTAQLEKRLQRDFDKNINRDFANSLGELLPKKIIPTIVEFSGIGAKTKCNQINKEMRKRLADLLKHFVVEVDSFRPIEEAIVTSGGVSVKEINPKTMESRFAKSLYFAGEVIDVNAYTGGFNLQIAFSTGFLAGKFASE